MIKNIKKRLLLGLAAVIPITVTTAVIWYLTRRIGALLHSLFSGVIPLTGLPGYVTGLIGFLIVVFLIYIIGLFASSFIGRHLFRLVDRLMGSLPLVKTLYTAVRHFASALFVSRSAFRRAVLVEFPQKGQYTIGFVTKERGYKNEDNNFVSLFVPTTPNITTGFYILSKKENLISLSIGVDEAFKVLISGGIISIKG